MKIGRIDAGGSGSHWALIDLVSSTARPITGDFEVWAPDAANGVIKAEYLSKVALRLDSIKLQAPLNWNSRVLAVGRNYGEHLRRLGAPVPKAPTAFIKPQTAIIGPFDDIVLPSTTTELDYEIELVAVLAAPLKAGAPAGTSLLGYTIGNDISARDAMRLADGKSDLFSQKACDRTTPVGPWIVTLDEFGGPAQPVLELKLSVNGELRQQDSTASMLFILDRCLDYVDDRVALRAADLLFTGSTHGVGLETGRFLQPGDVVFAEISRIGHLRNLVIKSPRSPRFAR